MIAMTISRSCYAAIAAALLTLGGQADAAVYSNLPSNTDTQLYVMDGLGHTFTLTDASVIQGWTYYSSPAATNVMLTISTWTGSAPGTTIYSTITSASSGEISSGPLQIQVGAGTYFAFLSDADGVLKTEVVLNKPGDLPSISSLYSVNSFDGWSTGATTNYYLKYTADISPAPLAPVPEAETGAMLLTGASLVAFLTRRRKLKTAQTLQALGPPLLPAACAGYSRPTS